MHEAPAMPLDELLRTVEAKGFRVSRDQLDRWRKKGLVPTPELHSLGRGRGRIALYPASTVTQLLVIAQLLERSRDFDVARWQLFLGGFSVGMPKLRAQLEAVLAESMQKREDVRAGTLGDDDEVARRYETHIAKFDSDRTDSPLVRYVRGRVRGPRRTAFSMLAIQMGAGVYPGIGGSEDITLVADAIGEDAKEHLTPEMFPLISRLLAPEQRSRALAAASDDVLLTARDEFVGVIPLARRIFGLVPGIGDTLALEALSDPMWPAPDYFLLWLAYREHPTTREVIDYLTASLPPLTPLPTDDTPTADD
jgi:hypothetical protein